MKFNKKIFRMFLPLVLINVLAPFSPAEGAMSDYCVMPPFLSQSIPPNVLIVLDNSGSMCDQAYAGSYNPAPFASGQYYGYFNGSKNYLYNGSRWEETTNAMTTGTIANPVASGSFLNWATMRRVEVAKKLLIGGKGNPRSWNGSVSVKLTGESACGSSWDFQKDFDTSAGSLIYPFVGNYRFTRSGDDLDISPLAGGTTSFDTYPIADISAPAGWSEFPVSGAMFAWSKVDETSSDGDTTYIENNNTTSPVLLDYNYQGSKPAGVITVTVKVRAKKTASGSTRSIKGVLRMGGVDYVSNTSSLDTSYANYSFTWTTNPATGAAWAWNDIKSSGIGSLQAFGVAADGDYTSRYPRVTQVYLNISIATPTGGPYNIIVDMGNVNATGIIDTLTGDVRFGLAYYDNSSNGGKVDTYIDFATPTNMINSIGNMTPSTWTPLGETLYEMTRYFRQDAPYYSNSPADYSTGLNYDPYWYKYSDLTAGLTDRYVPCAKSFILFLTDGESTQDTNILGTSTSSPYAACSLTNIKACSGFGGAPNNPNPRFAGTAVGTTYASSGTDYMIDVAYWARTNDMRPGTCTTASTVFNTCIPGTQNISLYTVFMFGRGSTLLKDAAIYGGFNDINGNNKPDCTTSPNECYKDSNGDGIVSPTAGVCSNNSSTSCTSDANCTSPGSCTFDTPLTYYEGEDGYELQTSITNAISDILRRVTSGTAASVLASGEGSGANLVQAVFYPTKKFASNQEVTWTGRLANMWYYVDPALNNSSIREDDGVLDADGAKVLNLKTLGGQSDYIAQFYFDPLSNLAKARRFTDDNGDGSIAGETQLIPDVTLDAVRSLWEAGTLLWNTGTGTTRTIWTPNITATATTNKLIEFKAGTQLADLQPYLGAATSDSAATLISWVRGNDFPSIGSFVPNYRKRQATIGGVGPYSWKLGDVLNSTPKISSWQPLNNYHIVYGDDTYGAPGSNTPQTDPVNTAHYTTAYFYKGRGMVFAGANDGMLHAFRLGLLELNWTGKVPSEKAKLSNKVCSNATNILCSRDAQCGAGTCSVSTTLGAEVWAFIPKNVLPYLQYTADPGYCHTYLVDLTPFIFDASIGMPAGCAGDYSKCVKSKDSWRTILIGGMRFGGGCRRSLDACNASTSGTPNGDCVKTPLADPAVPNKGLGHSSYFALDITDQNNPVLLWEYDGTVYNSSTTFYLNKLGFATSGPAVVRINANNASLQPDQSLNGKWFVVFGSGSTGPITSSDAQFLGKSDQNLTLHMFDIVNGPGTQNSNVIVKDTGIPLAFAGSLMSNTADVDVDISTGAANYSDDVVYVPYVRKDTSAGTWTAGGLGRLLTHESTDPATWTFSKVIEGTGPITSAVGKIENTKKKQLWLYFGSGRYFFDKAAVHDDPDPATRRQLFGFKDPCFNSNSGLFDTPCPAVITFCSDPVGATTCGVGGNGGLTNVSDVAAADAIDTEHVDYNGWYINLDPAALYPLPQTAASKQYRGERVITDPLASAGTGVVFFTSLKPSDDPCTMGGVSHIWATKYDNGGSPAALLKGKAIIQVSTGSIEQIDLSSAFTERGNRRSAGLEGFPPINQGLSVISSPGATKKVFQIKER